MIHKTTFPHSSNLVSATYDDTNNQLTISFNNGTYAYYDVPKSIFQGLKTATSAGEYHADYIKGAYAYEKIG